MTDRFEPPGPCPVCGEDVPSTAQACPGCGSCPESGWSEAAAHDSLDLPDSEFDYESYLAREFGSPRAAQPKRPAGWIAAVVIVLLLIWLLLR
jgi:hypothetical protein